jgi:hypothetical protein
MDRACSSNSLKLYTVLLRAYIVVQPLGLHFASQMTTCNICGLQP